MLLGCYRQGEAADPDVYAAAVAAVLAHYSEDVVRDVTDPITGLPGAVKWLPTVAEVRQACEDRLRPAREAQAREERHRETQKLLAAPVTAATAEQRARAVEKWEREKVLIEGKQTREDMRIAAEKRLPELYREVRANPLPRLGSTS